MTDLDVSQRFGGTAEGEEKGRGNQEVSERTVGGWLERKGALCCAAELCAESVVRTFEGMLRMRLGWRGTWGWDCKMRRFEDLGK